MRGLVLTGALCLLYLTARPQSATDTTAYPRKEWFPKNHLFAPILLDPIEAQVYGSALPFFNTTGERKVGFTETDTRDKELNRGTIVPFAFGFHKPFYRVTTAPGQAHEWGLDVGSFTQFQVFNDTSRLAKKPGQLVYKIINNDYKLSFWYNFRKGRTSYRVRLYHVSSHLGDDYIVRYQLNYYTPNAVNYELLDFTYSRDLPIGLRIYGGAGVCLRGQTERQRFNLEAGAYYREPGTKKQRLVGGVDVKAWQQTNFRPGIHAGIGYELGRSTQNLTAMLDMYYGYRPYGQYEYQTVAWAGIGLYFNPF
ncbi:DUF1207 domain-containing protein [Fibrella aquatilis]|uniref:DUF1207 domain-containing protein n=1 Tax=Fibrella aquatilis TaxID=2817059 RepID=A0A939GAP3_9BACT|nr:DUF1207 domain-containing protein [Fibrella aquatilis]MBO0932883.1 DUF1207 domain-containing protein [Fibrella aquatilis]